jgi:hypothetical protein
MKQVAVIEAELHGKLWRAASNDPSSLSSHLPVCPCFFSPQINAMVGVLVTSPPKCLENKMSAYEQMTGH